MSRYILYKQVYIQRQRNVVDETTHFNIFWLLLDRYIFVKSWDTFVRRHFKILFSNKNMILSSLKKKFKLTWDPVKILPPWQSRLVKGCGWARIAFFHSNFRSSSDEYLKKFSQLFKETPLLVLAWSAKILTNMVWWLERYHIF